MKKNFYILFIISTLISAGCVEEFNPDLEKYDNVLIVEGLLTNSPEECFVYISRSYEYQQKTGEKLSGAEVKVIDDLGNEQVFVEKEKGKYFSKNPDFAGIPGRSYQLIIKTPDNETYISDAEKMKPPVEIENIYFEPDKIIEDGQNYDGVQIYINAQDPENKVNYYAWEYKETWEFIVPYEADWLIGAKTCYISSGPKKFLLGTTIQNTAAAINKEPILFVSTRTNRLRKKYSLLVKQYSLSESQYKFLENLKNSNQTTGTLFDPTPIMMQGNMRSTNEKAKPMLGFFQVSGVSTKRIFITPDDLPWNYYVPKGFNCDSTSTNVIDSVVLRKCTIQDTVKFSDHSIKNTTPINDIERQGFILMDTSSINHDTLLYLELCDTCEVNIDRPFFIKIKYNSYLAKAYAYSAYYNPIDTFVYISFHLTFASSNSCFDCTQMGTNKKPDFW